MDDVTLALLTCQDGRPELWDTVESIEKRLNGPIVRQLMFVDGSTRHGLERLRREFPLWTVMGLSDDVRGFGPSMQSATAVATAMDSKWLMWFEDDFKLLKDIQLPKLAKIMEQNPEIAQVCFKRQPVWPHEVKMGNIFCDPSQFHQEKGYVKSNHYWTTNPSLMPMSVYRDNPWPSGDVSEKAFGDKIYAEGFWTATLGKWDDPPLIEHLGGRRTNVGY